MDYDDEKVTAIKKWQSVFKGSHQIVYLPNIDKVMVWRYRDSHQFFFEQWNEFDMWIKKELV